MPFIINMLFQDKISSQKARYFYIETYIFQNSFNYRPHKTSDTIISKPININPRHTKVGSKL